MICRMDFSDLEWSVTQISRAHHHSTLNNINDTRYTEYFLKVAPLKLFGIFSLWLSLFVWNFANLLAIQIHPPHICQFLYIYRKISSNGVNFSMSTHRFHCVKFSVLNGYASWASLGEKAIISGDTLTKGESWALLRKSAVESTTLAKPFCVKPRGRPATSFACTVCRCKTIFPLVGHTKL